MEYLIEATVYIAAECFVTLSNSLSTAYCSSALDAFENFLVSSSMLSMTCFISGLSYGISENFI